MKRSSRFLKPLAIALAWLLLGTCPAWAQQPGGKPVMENVFFNVVWGSAAGALVGGAIAVIGAQDKENPGNLSSAGFEGATVGGLAGLGLGIYFVFTGITFDPDRSSIFGGGPGFASLPTPALVPFALITDRNNPHRITGFRATVLDLRF